MRRPRVCRSPWSPCAGFIPFFFPSRQGRRRAGGRPLFSPVKGRRGGGSFGSARYGPVVCRMGRGSSGVGVQLLYNSPLSPLVMLYTVAWALVFGRYREPRPPSGAGGPMASPSGACWEGRTAWRNLERLS